MTTLSTELSENNYPAAVQDERIVERITRTAAQGFQMKTTILLPTSVVEIMRKIVAIRKLNGEKNLTQTQWLTEAIDEKAKRDGIPKLEIKNDG